MLSASRAVVIQEQRISVKGLATSSIVLIASLPTRYVGSLYIYALFQSPLSFAEMESHVGSWVSSYAASGASDVQARVIEVGGAERREYYALKDGVPCENLLWAQPLKCT